jgi:hypothetical protein
MKPLGKITRSAIVKRLMDLLPKELAVKEDLYDHDNETLSEMYLITTGQLFEVIDDKND